MMRSGARRAASITMGAPAECLEGTTYVCSAQLRTSNRDKA